MFNKRKTYLWLGLALLSVFLLVNSFTVLAEDVKDYGGVKFITISSGSGDWELIGGKVASIITQEIPGVVATSTPGGGVVNLSRVHRGESQIGLVHSAVTSFAVNGEEPFTEKHDKLRSLMTLWKSFTHVAVPKNSDINSISDLAKKPYNISISKPGLAQNFIALALLEAYGLTPEDIRKAGGVVHVIGMGDETLMMKDRRLDFLVFQVVYPFSMLIDINTGVGLKLLPIEGEAREKVMSLVPGLIKGSIPAGAYKGQDQEIPTVCEFSQFVCSSDLTDDLVYDIAEALVRNIPELKALSKSLKAISVDYAPLALGIELHPGARKYYSEQGMLKE